MQCKKKQQKKQKQTCHKKTNESVECSEDRERNSGGGGDGGQTGAEFKKSNLSWGARFTSLFAPDFMSSFCRKPRLWLPPIEQNKTKKA